MSLKSKLKKVLGLSPVNDAGTLRALEAVDRLDNDGSNIWKDLRKELTESGKLRDRYAIFCQRNMKGQVYEKAKDLANAIKQYEENIADERTNTLTSFPHYRLMVIYRRRKDYDNEIRVVRHALSLPIPDITQFTKRLEKLLALRDKEKMEN